MVKWFQSPSGSRPNGQWRLVLAALGVFLAFMGAGYFTYSRGLRSWSMMISMASLFGYGVLLYCLWYGSLALWIKKTRWASALLALPTLFLTYFSSALDISVMPAIVLAAAAGALNALGRPRSALLCGLGALCAITLVAGTNFWGGQTASAVTFFIGFTAWVIYLKLCPGA